MSASNEESPYNRSWLDSMLKRERPEREQRPSILESLCAPSQRVGAGDGDTYVAAPAPLRKYADSKEPPPIAMHDGQQQWLLGFKDHEVAAIVNELRRIALEYGGSQQLRSRIAEYLAPILKGERRP